MDLLQALLGAAEAAGYVLDTPGAYMRGALGGQIGDRLSGEEMLQNWGLIGENDPDAWELRDFAGPAAEMLLDPMNAIGSAAAAKAMKALAGVRKANAASDAMRAAGAMPEEIARLSAIPDATGMAMPVKHGTARATTMGTDLSTPTTIGPESFTDLSRKHVGQNLNKGWYGDAIYATGRDPTAVDYSEIAAGRAYNRLRKQGHKGVVTEPVVLEGRADVRNPWVVTDDTEAGTRFLYSLPEPVQAELLFRNPPPLSMRSDVDKMRENLGAVAGDKERVVPQGVIPEFYDAVEKARIARQHEWPQAEKLLHPEREFDSAGLREALQRQGYDATVVYRDHWNQNLANLPDEIAVFDDSQLYSTAIAPALLPENTGIRNALLASLLGYNAAMTPERAG